MNQQTKRGRAVIVRKGREVRGWEALAATVKIARLGKRPTSHSIAKMIGLCPSTYLRNLLHDLSASVPGFTFSIEPMPNGHWRRCYAMDTDILRRYSLKLWDDLSQYVSLQYPMQFGGGENGLPF